MNCKFIIGIDEVGRGPLAGPVAVGVALVPTAFNWSLLPGVTDSKKLSPHRRERIFARAKKLQAEGRIDFEVVFTSAKKIDQIGIVPAISLALTTALARITKRQPLRSDTVYVYLDGGLKAPPKYLHQETIVKGDLKEPVIGLASIIAKVTRDTHMERLAKKPAYTAYDFAAHKGYGTKQHRAAIARYGISAEHRQSFCRNITVEK